jgi:hypothetical protein
VYLNLPLADSYQPASSQVYGSTTRLVKKNMLFVVVGIVTIFNLLLANNGKAFTCNTEKRKTKR